MNMTIDPDKVVPIELNGDCNTTDEVILEQVRQNIRRGLPQIYPHQPNNVTAIVVCGGPSLESTKKDLARAVWAGGKIFACNGAYQWCIENNLKPSAALMLDAREFNSRFIDEPVDGCKYMLAAQCHPTTFDKCRGRETLIWHACSAGDVEVEMLKEYYFDHVTPVTLGTTIGIRAISLIRMLGFQSMEVFGLDSCWLDKEHHAYEQLENQEQRIPIWLRPEGRDDKAIRFQCAPWHMKQFEDFIELIKERGELFQLNLHGNGLLATMLRTGAEIQMEGPTDAKQL